MPISVNVYVSKRGLLLTFDVVSLDTGRSSWVMGELTCWGSTSTVRESAGSCSSREAAGLPTPGNSSHMLGEYLYVRESAGSCSSREAAELLTRGNR